MTDEPQNMVLELLRAIRADGDKTRHLLGEAINRLAKLEIGVASMRRDLGGDAVRAAEESRRLDGVIERIETIERRLELRDQ